MASLVKPPCLKEGDGVGLIVPSSPVQSHYLEEGMEALRDLGFLPRTAPGILRKHRFVAGSVAERVDETRGHDIVERFPLLGGKARVVLVGLRIGQIDILVGHIKIAAENHRLLLLQPFQIA